MGRIRTTGLAVLCALCVVTGSISWAAADAGRAKRAPDPLEQVAGPWVEVSGNETVFSGSTVRGVTVAGKTLVAWGTVGTTRAFWTSKDGLRWNRVPDAALGLTPEQLAAPAAGGRYTEFLVAGDADGVTAMVNRTVIASPDGVTWKPLAGPADGTALRDPALASTFSNPAEFVDFTLRALAVSGDARAAVGSGCWCAPFSSGDMTPFTIGSADGTSWSGGPVWSDGGGRGDLQTVAAAESGFVAAGYAGAITERSDAAVWRSTDGVAWTRVESPGLTGPDYEKITDLAANGDRLLGIGDHGNLPGLTVGYDFFRSDDGGTTWTRTPVDPAVFAGAPLDVLPVGEGFVVIGRSQLPGDPITTPTAFTTTDGVSFTPAWVAARTGALGITAISERRDGLVALLPEAVTSGAPSSTLVYVTGDLAKRAVKAKLATPPTTAAKPTGTTPSTKAAR